MVQAPPPPPPPFLPPWEQTRTESSHKQGRIEISVFATFLAFTIILVLGRLRFRGSTWMKICSSILAMGADKLITYITGLMGQLSASSDLYVLWVAFLAYLSTLATNSSCYTLVDNEEQKKSLVVQYTVAWGLIVGTLQASLAAPEIMVPVAFIFWITVLKIRERRRALLAATHSSFGMAKSTKVISDFSIFKEYEKEIIKGDPPYFVALKDDTHRVRYRMTEKHYKTKKKDGLVPFEWDHFITTNDVLQMKEEQGIDLKETCFSFAMFSLLLARIAGYYNVDVRVDFNELHRPIKEDEETTTIESITSSPFPLVSNKQQQQQQQQREEEEVVLFRLVEQELEFLYDYLYTNSYAIYVRGICKKIVDIGIIVLFFVLALPLIVEYRTQDHNAVYVLLGDHVLDTGFTRFVILAIFVSELTQFGIFLASKWGKVIYTRAHLRRASRSNTNTSPNNSTSTLTNIVDLIEIWMVKIACLIPRPNFKFACRGKSICAKVKLGQYSILKNYNKVPCLLWFSCWIGGYVEMPRWGQDGKEEIEISFDLKEAVVSCLNGWEKKDRQLITTGEDSLKANRVGDSLKANGVCDEIISEYLGEHTRLASQARIILIWHIATSLLEDEVSDNSKYFQVATKFSKYCAYLVALNPQMIPGHGGEVHTVECEFDQVVRELKNKYRPASAADKDDNTDEEKLVHGDQLEQPILSKGEQLMEALYPVDNAKVVALWKTLADFWTEMLLFLALRSDHREVIDAHANRLSVGGEFITHLWALLMHKGYQTRIATTTTAKNTQPSHGNNATATAEKNNNTDDDDAQESYLSVAN